MGKNPKHLLQYQGPGIVTKSLSPSNTSFEIKCNNRTYRRNIMHMSPYTSPNVVPAQLQVHIDNTVSVGTFVAVLDNSNDKRYHIAKVLDIGEHTTMLHYYGTRAPRLRNAIWHPVYTHPRTNVIIMEEPDTIVLHHMKYTGTIDTRPIDDSLIILPNVGMTDKLRINARSRQILRSKTGYSHHRLTHTWDR